MQRFYQKIALSSPGEGGDSGKSLPWSLPVYDKKDLVKLHCWDPHRCPQVPVVPWAWSPHCPENPALVPCSFQHPGPSPLSIQDNALKTIQIKIWANETDCVSQVNQVFKHVRPPMEMKNLILGQTGLLGSHRYNPGTPPQELHEANRGATQAQQFSFTCLFEFSSQVRVKVSDVGQTGTPEGGRGETPFSAMLPHCCPRGRFTCVSNP